MTAVERVQSAVVKLESLSDCRVIVGELAVLQEALRQASDPRFSFPWTGYDRAAIALADEILGDNP